MAGTIAVVLIFGNASASEPSPARERRDDWRQVAAQALGTARRMIASGNPAAAYALLRHTMQAAPADADTTAIRFAAAQALIAGGHMAQAAQLLENLAGGHPGASRVQLERALTLFALDHDDEAAAVFREVHSREDLPPAVRRNVEGFLERIRARQRLKVDFDFGFWRDGNVNNAPETDSVAIPAFGGLRFTPDRGPVRAWVARTRVRVRWREPVADGGGAYVETLALLARNTVQGASEYNRTQASVSTGPRIPFAVRLGGQRRPGLARADLGVERRWRGGEGYETALWFGPGLDQTLTGNWRAGVFPQVWTTRPDRGTGGANTRGHSIGLYVARRLGPGWLSASTRASRQTSKWPDRSWRSHEAALRYAADLGRNVSLSIRAGLTRTRFGGKHWLFRTSRKDRGRSLDLTLSHRKLVWKGYLPELTLSSSRTGSNIALYDRDLRTVRLGLRRLF